MRESTGTRLPRALLVTVGLLGAGIYAGGLFLEETRLGWLETHPITTNLIAGAVGFCSVTVVVGFLFNWISERGTRAAMERRLAEAITEFINEQMITKPTVGRASVGRASLGSASPMIMLARFSSRSLRDLVDGNYADARISYSGASTAREADHLYREFVRPYVERFVIDRLANRFLFQMQSKTLDMLDLGDASHGQGESLIRGFFRDLVRVVDTFEVHR